MERRRPLTGIILLAAQYGVRQILLALTGNPQMADLAREIFGQLSASEDRLISHLTRIEAQLEQVLAQPYGTAIGAGQRSLLDVIATNDSKARRKDLKRARDRFVDARGAARSQLQVAIAERYLLLCAIALNRPDAAKLALGQLNRAATTAALEVGDAISNAYGMARHDLEQRGEARGFGKGRRLTERTGEIRRGANEAVQLVGNLLSEAGVIGQMYGQTQPPSISTASPKKRSPAYAGASTLLSSLYPSAASTWRVVLKGPGPRRVGAFIVTWDRFEFSGAVQRAPIGFGTSANLYGFEPGPVGAHGPRYTRDVQVDVKIEVDPPLSRSVPLELGWGSVRDHSSSPYIQSVSGFRQSRQHVLPEGARLYHLKETVTTSTNPDGKIIENRSVRVGAFEVC
jgi:hypothetical protein